MGFLKLFAKRIDNGVVKLPTGTFTVDSQGAIVASTLPQTFSKALALEIGTHVVTVFQSAREAQIPLTELVVQYAAMKLTSRELRGGAIIFMAPQIMGQK